MTRNDSGDVRPKMANILPLALLLAVVSSTLSVRSALGAAGGVHLRKGERHLFAANAVHLGGTVTCTSNGIHIASHIPGRGQAAASIGDGLHGAATLILKTLAGGRVMASCS